MSPTTYMNYEMLIIADDEVSNIVIYFKLFFFIYVHFI